MADDIRDGTGAIILRGDQAANRGMDPKAPFYTRAVNAAGGDVSGSGVAASSSPAQNTSTVTADTSGSTGAATNVVPVAANLARQFAMISNTGANPMLVRFGAAATGTVGHPLAAGATMVLDTKVPTASINLFSTTGTTYTITTG